MDQITEFTELDPDEFHLVPEGATGFPILLAKAAEMVEAEKAEMDAKERHGLADSEFAFPKQRKEPINDEAHVRNAISRFDQVEGVSSEDKHEAARRIMARAKHFGIHVSEDSNVARAAKQTAPDKAVPRGEAEDQTDEHVEGDPADGSPPEPGDGGTPTHQELASDKPPRGTGQGDVAPDQSVPRGEAESQTPGAQKADRLPDEVDGTGDAAPDEDAAACDEAESQTRSEKADADDKPGSDAWEHKDVALGERAERLVAQLGDVVSTFTEREKAEGGASKSFRRVLAGVKYLTNHKQLLKEFAEMSSDELIKALDELGAKARRAEKKAAKAAAQAKEAKRVKKDAKAAKKAAKAAGEDAADTDLAKALARAEEAEKAAREARETVEKMAAEDGKRILVNGVGLAAVLRDPSQGPDVMKQLDDTFEAAKAAYDQDPSAANKAALTQAGQRRTAARLIAGEHNRQTSLEAIARTQRGQGNPVFSNTITHGLIDDHAVSYR